MQAVCDRRRGPNNSKMTDTSNLDLLGKNVCGPLLDVGLLRGVSLDDSLEMRRSHLEQVVVGTKLVEIHASLQQRQLARDPLCHRSASTYPTSNENLGAASGCPFANVRRLCLCKLIRRVDDDSEAQNDLQREGVASVLLCESAKGVDGLANLGDLRPKLRYERCQ